MIIMVLVHRCLHLGLAGCLPRLEEGIALLHGT